MKSNIVLIGMPGAGKSTVGVLLAKTLGMAFVDTDLLIQQATGRLLQDIINTDGVTEFLQVETRVVLGLQAENTVIATGGSVVYSAAAISHLQKTGRLFYLKLSYHEIESRINNMSSRGIAMAEGQRLLDLYQERVPLYERAADQIIDCTDTTIEQVVGLIKKEHERFREGRL